MRHISDIKVDSAGIVYITSASDAGDDGPFQSALYVAGYLGFSGNKIVWKQNSQLVPLYRADYRKIEGMELVPGNAGGVVFGTDDENFGSYVYVMGSGEWGVGDKKIRGQERKYFLISLISIFLISYGNLTCNGYSPGDRTGD